MDSRINNLVKFAATYFNANEKHIYGHVTTDDCSIARYFIWYHLHYHDNISVGTLGKAFGREKRTIFYGLKKIKSCIQMQACYRNMYGMFIQGYEESLGK